MHEGSEGKAFRFPRKGIGKDLPVVWSIKAATIPIFFGGGVAFLLALEQLVRKKPNKANVLFSLVFFCIKKLRKKVRHYLSERHTFSYPVFLRQKKTENENTNSLCLKKRLDSKVC